MTTTFLNIPPHLHTSTPPHLHTSTPPHLHTSSPPHLLTSTPPHLHTSTPPHLHTSTPPYLLTSTALWYPQWTKYLLPSSSPPLSGAPSGPTLLSGGPSGALWRPKWHSLTPLVALSGASRGNLKCSLAPLAETLTKIPIIYYCYECGHSSLRNPKQLKMLKKGETNKAIIINNYKVARLTS